MYRKSGREVQYFSLIIDLTASLSHIDQLTLVLRYVGVSGDVVGSSYIHTHSKLHWWSSCHHCLTVNKCSINIRNTHQNLRAQSHSSQSSKPIRVLQLPSSSYCQDKSAWKLHFVHSKLVQFDWIMYCRKLLLSKVILWVCGNNIQLFLPTSARLYTSFKKRNW